MEDVFLDLKRQILSYRFDVYSEKELQRQMDEMVMKNLGYSREHRFDKKNIIDFYNKNLRIGIECKIKGSALEIHRQISRYAQFKNELDLIVLVSAVAMNLPAEINGIPIKVILLGRSWL